MAAGVGGHKGGLRLNDGQGLRLLLLRLLLLLLDFVGLGRC
jgi:hypothetical protein